MWEAEPNRQRGEEAVYSTTSKSKTGRRPRGPDERERLMEAENR